jgi:hypothetical protein
LEQKGVTPADLSKAIAILRDLNDSKAAWSQLYNNGLPTKVKVLHIGSGKFRIVDDIDGGIHVGKIVDASDLI